MGIARARLQRISRLRASSDLEKYYSNLRWPGWREEIASLGGDQALSIQPPLWTAEGKHVATAVREPMPVAEAYDFNVTYMPQKLASLSDGTQIRFNVT